jgi:hypothetical protein
MFPCSKYGYSLVPDIFGSSLVPDMDFSFFYVELGSPRQTRVAIVKAYYVIAEFECTYDRCALVRHPTFVPPRCAQDVPNTVNKTIMAQRLAPIGHNTIQNIVRR